MAPIDEWLPSFDLRTQHEVALGLSAEAGLKSALAAPAAPDRFVRTLFRLRGLRPDGSIAHFLTANGFTVLERTATSYVVGGLLDRRRVPLRDATAWRAAGGSPAVRVAAEIRAVPWEGGSRLMTETRVAAGSLLGLIGFRIYWLFVGPFSSLIRRRWLRAAVEGRVTVA